jgi:hypothetical protein
MNTRKKRISGPAVAMAACLGMLLAAGPGCKNSTTPDDTGLPKITVRNNCGIAVDIFMDGTYQFFLEYKEYYYLENVATGTHVLTAKKKGTDKLLKSATAEINETSNYTWTISSTASVAITNNYGETLDIYGDGVLQDTIETGKSDSISNITYGEHPFEAKLTGTSTIVASTVIDITEDKGYTWTITK